MNNEYFVVVWRLYSKKKERGHQKVYIRSIYSKRQYFCKNRAVSLGYPMGMFGVSFGAISCLDRERVYETSCCYGYMVRRWREKLPKMSLIVAWCDKERALIVAQYYKERAPIGVWWDKIVLDWCADLSDEIVDLRGFEVRVNGCLWVVEVEKLTALSFSNRCNNT